MDKPLAPAHRYRAVVAAADGSLWGEPAQPPAQPPAPIKPPPATPPYIVLETPPESTPTTPLAPPTIPIAGGSVVEGRRGRRWLAFSITLSHAWDRPVRVVWGTANGTASAGRDYVRSSGRIAFPKGQTLRTVRVAVIGDRLREPDEFFCVSLWAPSGGRLADLATAADGWISVLPSP